MNLVQGDGLLKENGQLIPIPAHVFYVITKKIIKE